MELGLSHRSSRRLLNYVTRCCEECQRMLAEGTLQDLRGRQQYLRELRSLVVGDVCLFER